jgi:predicted enzyme related to lactoylglutathione lyase
MSDTLRPGGLRTVIYQVPDLPTAKHWYAAVFQRTPYFDEPFYVGFNVGGYELGLHPADAGQPIGPGGSTAYWGVQDLVATLAHLATTGIEPDAPLQDVGGGIRVATIRDPFGNLIGLIENPHFTLTDAPG